MVSRATHFHICRSPAIRRTLEVRVIQLLKVSKLLMGNRFHRSLTRPFFTRVRVCHFDIFERHADDAINQLKARLKEGYPVNFQVLALPYLLIIIEVLPLSGRSLSFYP
jgi:hypothetical protein